MKLNKSLVSGIKECSIKSGSSFRISLSRKAEKRRGADAGKKLLKILALYTWKIKTKWLMLCYVGNQKAMRRIVPLMAMLFTVGFAVAQTGIVRGKVTDATNNEPVPFATVQIQGTQLGAITDLEGKFEITGVTSGLYNIEASFVGYETQTIYEIQVTTSRPAYLEIRLKEGVTSLQEVEIVASPFNKPEESPVSLRTIGINEIQRAPGGNRDISKVLRSLPGVASTVSFRNDIIIRGGAPGENKFFIDGIEIPTINHFQTQGSSGGPVGILNVDFLREVDFYSGAFPSNRGNALSSIFDFKLKDGREDKITLNAVLGASDIGAILEGPVNEKSTFLFSARRSYLQFLFGVIGLPFLPTYNDVQFKYKIKLDKKNQITFLGLGAYDDFELNFDANETEFQRYFLANLPVSGQWNYTVGTKYEHFRENGFTTFVVSTNNLFSSSYKYRDNDESTEANLIQDYKAREKEIKLRVEDYSAKGIWKFNYGANLERALYKSSNFNRIVTPQGVATIDNEVDFGFNKFGLFGNASVSLAEGSVVASVGFRADANDYSDDMNNPLEQLSPRASLAWYLTERLSLNFNTGIYYQLPPYTILGFTDNDTGELINRANDIKYIRADHLVGGLEYDFGFNARTTLEGFYKRYSQYPFLLDDQISLANLGADFGAIGNAPANSTSNGRSYGVEYMYQQKLFKGFYGILAYTFVRSEFQDRNGDYIASSWDNRHLISVTGGKKFGKDWELGFRWLFSGGAPFTPFNVEETVRAENWAVRPFGIPDYTRLNSQRGGNFHQLDLRIDKKFFFDRWSLNLYFDVQNAYNFVALGPDFIDVEKDGDGNPIADPNMPGSYIPKFIPNENGTLLPTLGIIIEL